jgi:hypothetical protein
METLGSAIIIFAILALGAELGIAIVYALRRISRGRGPS